MESVAKVTNEWRNRLEEPTWHTDWSIDWGQTDESVHIFRLTLVETAESQPYSVLTVVSILPTEQESNDWYAQMVAKGKDDDARRLVVESLSAELNRLNVRVLLQDQFEKVTQIYFNTDHGQYMAAITTRLLGTDTGRNVLFETAQQIDGIRTQMQNTSVQSHSRA